MNYRLTLQIVAAVITGAILVALHYGVGSLLDGVSPDFTSGLLVGGVGVGAVFGVAHWIERRSASDTPRRR